MSEERKMNSTRFGRPARGNDKGKVEGIVGYSRRNFLVPIPRVTNPLMSSMCVYKRHASK